VHKLFTRLLILTALWLLLMLGLGYGAQIQKSSPALASEPQQAVLVQTNGTDTRPGKRAIAQEIAERSVENEFGVFNLFIIFFVTLGPLKVIPVFVQLTRNASRALRWQLAIRSTVVSTIVILLVVLIGSNLLEVWQIQLPALMIAGGILLSLVALQLVLVQYTPKPAQEPSPDNPGLHLAITPLAFPTILPPFGIAIALTLMIVSTQLGLSPWVVIALLLGVMALNLASMVAARPIFKFIRPVTLKILGFTLGVMQFALGIQFILTGLEIQGLVIQILLKGE
jgi:multiple antibiotic resistance protein